MKRTTMNQKSSSKPRPTQKSSSKPRFSSKQQPHHRQQNPKLIQKQNSQKQQQAVSTATQKRRQSGQQNPQRSQSGQQKQNSQRQQQSISQRQSGQEKPKQTPQQLQNSINSLLPFFTCVINSASNQWDNIDFENIIRDKIMEHKFQERLQIAMIWNLQTQKSKTNKLLMQNTELKNKQHQQNCIKQLRKQSSEQPSHDTIVKPNELMKCIKTDLRPYFTNSSIQSRLENTYDIYLQKWTDRQKWADSNYRKLLVAYNNSKKLPLFSNTSHGKRLLRQVMNVVITFAYKPKWLSNTQLAFVYLDSNKTNRETMVQTLQMMLFNGGLLCGNPQEPMKIHTKENFLGKTNAETQQKTMAMLKSNLGQLVILEDIQSSMSDNWKKRGTVVLETIYNFLKKNRGNIAIIILGNSTRIPKGHSQGQNVIQPTRLQGEQQRPGGSILAGPLNHLRPCFLRK